uniref:Putative 6-phosphofructo-2-kinase/fructose-2,6-biphosphatase n=1 Tax=Trypanosoma congolense (strain IL3000) TaxID=1068625 RepID=G0UR42_TRYCI|nr:putative 6-phosphofructo-2-kinase/fructose-2,6-biphosphatase [Trypanosoma congolense IL3000]
MEVSRPDLDTNSGSVNGCGADGSFSMDEAQRIAMVCELTNKPIRPFNSWKWRGVNIARNAEIASAEAQSKQNSGELNSHGPIADIVSGSVSLPHDNMAASTGVGCTPVDDGGRAGALGSQVPPEESNFTSNWSAKHGVAEPSDAVSPPLDNYTGPISYQGPQHFVDRTHSYTTLCIIMVGLPARGKTFLAHKICRLLGWHGHRAKVINVQFPWRRLIMEHFSGVGEGMDFSGGKGKTQKARPAYVRAEHFRALVTDQNSIEHQLYHRVLQQCAQDAQKFYADGGEVLVINDDFPTEELRREAEVLFSPLASQTFFMEVVRSSDLNKRFDEIKVKDTAEYNSSVEITDAQKDFDLRVQYLESVYTDIVSSSPSTDSACDAKQTATEQRCGRRYIRIKNFEELEVCGVTGYVASRIVFYVMNITQMKVQHPIYFVRDGMSVYQCEKRIGGDSPLSPEGEQTAKNLLGFIASLRRHVEQGEQAPSARGVGSNDDDCNDNGTNAELCGVINTSFCSTTSGGPSPIFEPHGKVEIWTSQLHRALQTVEMCEQVLGVKTIRCRSLNELHAGVFENLTHSEVREQCSLMEKLRNCNKFSFRYPKGESYKDLVQRLEPVIMELENADRVVVVVGHHAVLRALLTYFGSISSESCVWLDVPYDTVWRCTYDSKGMTSLEEMRFDD